jgi:hypothetical protein
VKYRQNSSQILHRRLSQAAGNESDFHVGQLPLVVNRIKGALSGGRNLELVSDARTTNDAAGEPLEAAPATTWITWLSEQRCSFSCWARVVS